MSSVSIRPRTQTERRASLVSRGARRRAPSIRSQTVRQRANRQERQPDCGRLSVRQEHCEQGQSDLVGRWGLIYAFAKAMDLRRQGRGIRHDSESRFSVHSRSADSSPSRSTGSSFMLPSRAPRQGLKGGAKRAAFCLATQQPGSDSSPVESFSLGLPVKIAS